MPNGPNIAFSVPVAGATVTFTYDASTHVLTIAATVPGAPAAPARSRTPDLARKDCLGTARNTRLEGLVHGRERRSERRLYPTVDNTNLETPSTLPTALPSPTCRPAT